MRNKKVLFITQAAMIAALYVVLTVFISAFNLASGSIQIRISEALCILPYFTPAAIPGLWIGCLLANLVTGASLFDIIFGSLATLLGAIFTYLLGKKGHKFLCTLPPVISNAFIVAAVLTFFYKYPIPDVILNVLPLNPGSTATLYFFNVVTVGIGEIISVCLLGSILLKALDTHKEAIFKQDEE